MNSEIKNQVLMYPDYYCAKEIMWDLRCMGVFLNEDEIKSIRLENCKCSDDSGSCAACNDGGDSGK